MRRKYGRAASRTHPAARALGLELVPAALRLVHQALDANASREWPACDTDSAAVQVFKSAGCRPARRRRSRKS